MTDTTSPTQSSADKTQSVREELTAEAGRLAAHLEDIRAETMNLRTDRVGHDSVDDGAAQTETEQAGQVAISLQDRLEQTTAAIRRLDDGTYGQCERCGKPISPGRLEVRPTATTCINCA